MPDNRSTSGLGLAIASALMLAAMLTLTAVSAARAEVKKFVHMCGGDQQLKLCPSYQLVLHPPEGWVEDRAATGTQRVQIIVPKGQTFAYAPALIYVKVSLRNKEQPLDDFIRVSNERWVKSVPDAKIEKIGETARENGKPAFVSYRYDNPSKPQQAAEMVSFGLDNDNDGNEFVLMVVITGREKKALDQADQPYKAFLRAQ